MMHGALNLKKHKAHEVAVPMEHVPISCSSNTKPVAGAYAERGSKAGYGDHGADIPLGTLGVLNNVKLRGAGQRVPVYEGLPHNIRGYISCKNLLLLNPRHDVRSIGQLGSQSMLDKLIDCRFDKMLAVHKEMDMVEVLNQLQVNLGVIPNC